jgi:hypothetical protein
MREGQRNIPYLPVTQSKEFLGYPQNSNVFGVENEIQQKSGKRIMGRQGELKDNPILPMTAQQERLSNYEQEMKRLY